MSNIYNSYLTGTDRELAIIKAEYDAKFAKLDFLYESVEAALNANMLTAEAKVFSESGTYDDLTMLYTEAQAEAAEKQQNIIGKLIDTIVGLINKVKNFILEKFGKNKEAIPDDPIKVKKGLFDKITIFNDIWNFISNTINNIKNAKVEDIKNKFDEHKNKLAAAAAATGVITVARKQIMDGLQTIEGILSKAQEKLKFMRTMEKETDKFVKAASKNQNTDNIDTKSKFVNGVNKVANAAAGVAIDVLRVIIRVLQSFVDLLLNWVKAINALVEKVKHKREDGPLDQYEPDKDKKGHKTAKFNNQASKDTQDENVDTSTGVEANDAAGQSRSGMELAGSYSDTNDGGRKKGRKGRRRGKNKQQSSLGVDTGEEANVDIGESYDDYDEYDDIFSESEVTNQIIELADLFEEL